MMNRSPEANAHALERISGAVDRVTFHSEESGFCVLRVGKSELRRKMPYEIARNYIIHDLRGEAVRDFHQHFETILLNRHHFFFGTGAAGQTRVSAPADPARVNNQP